MKVVVFSLLIGILLGANLLAIVPQDVDPPQNNPVAYCAMNSKETNGQCDCASEDVVGGVACTRNDNDRPRFCKWKCGHARACGCCVS